MESESQQLRKKDYSGGNDVFHLHKPLPFVKNEKNLHTSEMGKFNFT